MRLSLQVYDNFRKDRMIADLTAVARNGEFVIGKHGYLMLSFDVPARTLDALNWYEQPTLYVLLNVGGMPVWEGRLEDVTPIADGVRLVAYGYWRSMYDLPYTYLWSDTRLGRWAVTSDDLLSSATPSNFSMDKNERLFISPNKGADYATSGPDRGEWYYKEPDRQRGSIKEVTFDYEMESLSSDWTAELRSFDFGYASLNTEWSLAGDGTTQTGSVTATLSTARDYVAFSLKPTSTVTGFAPETGEQYIKITNVRVKGTDSTSVYADEIAEDIISFISTTNSDHLSDSVLLVESPAVDLKDEVYEDVYPGDILIDLTTRGDSQTPPALYECGVMEKQRLYFRELGSEARAWDAVSVEAPEIGRSLDRLQNSIYAIYQDERGAILRTSNGSDAASIDKYGLTRRRAIRVVTTSQTQAETARDAVLEDKANIVPRASIQARWLLNNGGLAPPWLARPNDTIVLRNMPIAQRAVVDRLFTFRLRELTYYIDEDYAMLIPEEHPESVDFSGLTPSQSASSSSPFFDFATGGF